MAKLVSSWYNNVSSLPADNIFPPETRPGDQLTPICKKIPVVDLQASNATQQILKASEEFGFFQVINHGVYDDLVDDKMSVLKEFFEMPDKDKADVCSEDPKRLCRLYTSSINYYVEDVHFWRDNLRHPCHPLENYIHLWPQKPTRYREVVGAWSVEVRKLALRILKMIGEGLGLDHEYFRDELIEELLLSVNHYPPCPEPSLSLGVPKHADPNVLAILKQEDVSGLPVCKDGKWIGVEPIPNAFVVNIGHTLQIISTGKLKSVEHRAVTNSSQARTTAVFHFVPPYESIIEPVKALLDALNPPLYKRFVFKEFLGHCVLKQGSTEAALKPFKLPQLGNIREREVEH